jgi:hypothetical protein
MGRQIRVRAIEKEEPNVHLYVLALIALARQLQEEDERLATEAQTATLATGTSGEGSHERG